VFLDDTDRHVYIKMLLEQSIEEAVRIWAWCLMNNHVHLIAVPDRKHSLSRALQRVHGEYAGYFNSKHSKSGHLWQGRFKSALLDERHLWNAVRYVERNPVRAQMVKRASDYIWSSAAAHCGLRPDRLISSDLPLLGEIPDWEAWLTERELQEDLRLIRERTRTGRPCADDGFVRNIELRLGRKLLPQKAGRKSIQANTSKSDNKAIPT
jgi:putative transposase